MNELALDTLLQKVIDAKCELAWEENMGDPMEIGKARAALATAQREYQEALAQIEEGRP